LLSRTLDTETGVKAVSAALRVAPPSAAVDNWSTGAVLVPADIDTGELAQHGVIKEGLVIVDSLPQTGLRFGGLRLPHYREAVRMACRLHENLDLASAGWDIALLRDGPCIMEANRFWGVYSSAQLNPRFLPMFLDFHLLPGTAAMRLEISGTFTRRYGIRMWLCEIIGRSRASARVVQFSQDKLVLMVGGAPSAIEMVMGYVMQSARRHRFGDIRTIPETQPVSPGLDIRATFPV
jgi:Sugar-transfer associated ATP-grasp